MHSIRKSILSAHGTLYGLAAVLVVKVAIRSDLARLMGVNAGRIANGQATIVDVGWELFRLILDMVGGRQTWAKHWKLHNAVVLFNPASVT